MPQMPYKYPLNKQYWIVGVYPIPKKVVCPKCLGKKVCTLGYDNGETLELDCPYCRKGFQPTGFIDSKDYEYKPIPITPVAVSIDGNEIRYKEWVTGGGTLFDEKDLFISEEECLKKCQEKAEWWKKKCQQGYIDRVEESFKRVSDEAISRAAYFEKEIERLEQQIQSYRQHIKTLERGSNGKL